MEIKVYQRSLNINDNEMFKVINKKGQKLSIDDELILFIQSQFGTINKSSDNIICKLIANTIKTIGRNKSIFWQQLKDYYVNNEKDKEKIQQWIMDNYVFQ